jgi:hypothetical protein
LYLHAGDFVRLEHGADGNAEYSDLDADGVVQSGLQYLRINDFLR